MTPPHHVTSNEKSSSRAKHGTAQKIAEATGCCKDVSHLVVGYLDPAELWMRNQIETVDDVNNWKCPPYDTLLYYACTDSPDVIFFLERRWPKFFKSEMWKLASESGNLELAKRAHQNTPPPHSKKVSRTLNQNRKTMLMNAVKRGNMAILGWALEAYSGSIGEDVDALILMAIIEGRLPVLIALNNRYNITYTEDDTNIAAEYGHTNIMRWLRESQHAPWNSFTCRLAAMHGNLEVLQWMVANGCPWDEATCSAAARYGYLEILQWARANGCPWDHRTCKHASDNGHTEILQWARANGCPST